VKRPEKINHIRYVSKVFAMIKDPDGSLARLAKDIDNLGLGCIYGIIRIPREVD